MFISDIQSNNNYEVHEGAQKILPSAYEAYKMLAILKDPRMEELLNGCEIIEKIQVVDDGYLVSTKNFSVKINVIHIPYTEGPTGQPLFELHFEDPIPHGDIRIQPYPNQVGNPLLGALPPYAQRLNELTAILSDKGLMEVLSWFGCTQSLQEIEKTEDGYVLRTEHLTIPVKVIYGPTDRPGPVPFKLEFAFPK